MPLKFVIVSKYSPAREVTLAWPKDRRLIHHHLQVLCSIQGISDVVEELKEAEQRLGKFNDVRDEE